MNDFCQSIISHCKTFYEKYCKKHRCIFLCTVLPAAIMFLMYLSRGLYPFGDGSVLVLDLNAQYVWFFEALRNAVKGEASLVYSFSRALGGEFLGIYAYYLASPLSYIVCLFPEDKMLEALFCLFFIKTGICGGTFGYYLRKTAKTQNAFSTVIFSVLYALSAYAVIQQHNTMWIDAVMWLPLVTLGIEELVKYGKFKRYTIFLFLTVFSTFYIGYMVCIYCVLYFFYFYYAYNNEQKESNPLCEKTHFWKSFLRMVVFSLIAVGGAAVIILGTYYSLNFGKTSFSDPGYGWYLNFDIQDFLYKLLPGSYDTVRPEGYPFVYCGVLTLLLVPSYFLCKKFNMREKIATAGLLLVFLASFSFDLFDMVWHGFQSPNWLNFRYSFMFCFLLCVIAARTFAEFESLSLKVITGSAGLLALLCVILQKYSDGKYVDPDDYTCIFFTLGLLFLYLSLLGLLRSTKHKRYISTLLLSAILAETFINGIVLMQDFDDDVIYTSYSSYNDYLNDLRPIVEEVQSQDSGFYRMEKEGISRTNDNMALNVNGLTGSTSTLNKETVQFLNKMGYASKSHWSKYKGGNPVNDSLLGVKYIISDTSLYSGRYTKVAVAENGIRTAYQNPYALSVAYGVDDALLDFKMGYTNVSPTTGEDETVSPVKTFVKELKSTLNEIFDIEETINQSEYLDSYDNPFDRLNAMITSMLGEDETVKVFVPVGITKKTANGMTEASGNGQYTSASTETNGTLKYEFVMPASSDLYFFLPTARQKEVALSVSYNGSEYVRKGRCNGNDTSCIIHLGTYQKSDSMKLCMELKENTLYIDESVNCLYYLDWAVFEDAISRLSKDQLQVEEHTGSSLSGTLETSKDGELILTTLAFDEGWNITVDGKPVEAVKVLGSLVAFRVESAGTHTVSMRYWPKILTVGIITSAVFIAIFVLILILEKKLKKVPGIKTLLEVPEPKEDISQTPQEVPIQKTADEQTEISSKE